MGVEGFKPFLARHPGFKKCFQKKVPSRVSSLFMDCNGIFYSTAAVVYKTEMTRSKELIHPDSERKKLLKKDKGKLEQEHFQKIVERIIEAVETIKPQDNLIITVDGPANSAKLVQQKERRFKKSLEKELKYKIFDNTVITPGTEFMIRLDEYLQNWLETYKGYLPKRIIYSSHLDPGEGEHKIFHFVREKKIIEGSGANVIYGLDNDLIIISIVNNVPRMFMFPEDGSDILDIEKLKQMIIEEMEYEGSDKKTIIRDFCVVSTLQGNDFLRKFPNVPRDTSENFRLIFKVYSQFLKAPLTDKNNNIIWKNYMNFLQSYARYKNKTVFNYLYIEMFKQPRKGYQEIDQNIRVRDKYGNIINQVYNPEKHTLLFDFKNFRDEWYMKQFNDSIVQWDGSVVEGYTREDIYAMVESYLKTVQWVQYYYTKGYKYVSDYQFYHYLYNPLMEDVISGLKILIEHKMTKELSEDVVRKEDEIEITPVHQLLSVLHYNNLDNIPKKFQKIYKKDLLEINPLEFELFEEDYSKGKEHQKHANMPLVNIPFIDERIKQYKLSIPRNLQRKYPVMFERDNEEDYSISHDDLI